MPYICYRLNNAGQRTGPERFEAASDAAAERIAAVLARDKRWADFELFRCALDGSEHPIPPSD